MVNRLEKNWDAFHKFRRTFRLGDERELYKADVVFRCENSLLNYEGTAFVLHNLKGTHGSNYISLDFDTDLPLPTEYWIEYQTFTFDEIFKINGNHPEHGEYNLEIFPK